MKNQFLAYAILAAGCGLITACSHTAEPAQQSSKTQPQAQLNTQAIVLYSGQATTPGIRVVIESPAAQQELVNDKADVPKVSGSSAPNADVSVIKSDKNSKGDALTFTWKDSWRAGLNFEAASPLDLTSYTNKGVVSFDLNVIDLAKGGLAFKTKCGNNCERQIPFLLSARELIGKGWQHINVPLQCFVHEGDNFSAVNLPFALEAGGSGSVAVANLRVEKSGESNITCPDYKTVAVTPAMLNEWWSIDWWQARHQQKLDEVTSLQATHKNAEVIFIGDSITQGWEKDGFNVWNKNYKKYNAVALGFGGDRTENILWRLQHGEVDGLHPKVTVLMFGTNNTGHRREAPELTAIGIKRNIDELQQRLPDTKILLLAIFPRDAKPDGELRQINTGVNTIISGFADHKKIFFLDINQAFLDDKGVLSTDIMPDLLHPNEHGYELWANAMEPALVKLLKTKN